MNNDDASLWHDRYPLANKYAANWVYDNQMGPNALWLIESLTEVMTIEPGMKILDLGCGKAMTSIFLAKELGATQIEESDPVRVSISDSFAWWLPSSYCCSALLRSSPYAI